MIELYEHQREAVKFLVKRPAAMLADSMGLGKTRSALVAALELFAAKKIDRVLVLAPAAVRYSWRTEIDKFDTREVLPCIYDSKKGIVWGAGSRENRPLPVLIVSYSLLPQQKHVEALSKWCFDGSTALVADESSFLKSRTAKQTKGAASIAESCCYRWLLTGTPIANSPLDLYAQAKVMSDGDGPLKNFSNFYAFRARYAVLQSQRFGGRTFQSVVSYQNISELTKKFAPYVLRRTKEECLDLPSKTYVVREVALSDATWKIYQELKKEAMLCLPDSEERPEPNAAVRILRLCQLTSGHVGTVATDNFYNEKLQAGETFSVLHTPSKDVSSEKLDYIANSILEGELSNENALIVWCRWRRERERLRALLATKIETYGVFGGQQDKNRSEELGSFNASKKRRVLLAQPHAGGYGLNLTAASTAVFLSNDFSFVTRIQAEDRQHRILQTKPCLYIDVVATSPSGGKTVDRHILECLRAKKSLSEMTCSAWKRALE